MPIFGPDGQELKPDPTLEAPELPPPAVPTPIDLPTNYKDNQNVVPMNDELLVAAEVLGRCSVCSVTGYLEWPGNKVPWRDAEKVISYKAIEAFCPRCKRNTLFLPIEVKKYTDSALRILHDDQAAMRGRTVIGGKNEIFRGIVKP